MINYPGKEVKNLPLSQDLHQLPRMPQSHGHADR